MSSLIQWHKPMRTSNTLVKPLIQTTFPPSPLSLAYPKIIGTMTLSILFPPMMNQRPQMTSMGTLWMTTCIFISDSPLPQSSSHPNQAQRSGGKFVWRWQIRHPLSVGSIKQPSPTSSWPYSRVGFRRLSLGILRIQTCRCYKNGTASILSMSRCSVGRPSISSSLTSLLPMSGGSLPCSQPQQCSNSCDENSRLPLTLHGTASPKASLSVLRSKAHMVQSPFAHGMHTLHLIGPPLLDSDGVPQATNQMPSITLSTKMHEMSSCIILMDMPLSCMAALYGILPWRVCQMTQS